MLKEDVLSVLEDKKDSLVTGEELARQLGVSRTAVWKAVCALREEGYGIESLPRLGYRFLSRNDILSGQAIRKKLRTKFMGNQIEVLKTVDSTNTYMKKKDLPSIQEGLVVIADGQSGGRGRRNRLFCSPPGEGLYLSILLKPNISPADTRFLTVCSALAVCRALETACGLKPEIKWVNDVWCGGLKLCGILTEGAVSVEQQTMSHVVIGIGINTGTVPEEVRHIATSVSRLSGRKPERNELAAELLNQLESFSFDLIDRGRKKELLDDYRKRQFIIGRSVDVLTPQGSFRAVPTDIDEDGALVVRNDAGEILHLCSEEISLRL